jgi:hypothetical protein
VPLPRGLDSYAKLTVRRLTGVKNHGVRIAESNPDQHRRPSVASYREELERRGPDGIPSLDDIEPGKICGAVIPMSERAQTQMRDSIEVIDFLLNQERVVWS